MDDDDQDLYPEVDADDDYDAFVTVKEEKFPDGCNYEKISRSAGLILLYVHVHTSSLAATIEVVSSIWWQKHSSCSVCLKGNFNGMLRLSAAPMSSMKLALMSCF